LEQVKEVGGMLFVDFIVPFVVHQAAGAEPAPADDCVAD